MEMTEIRKRLTQDLLVEILARLPMKSIVRFRAVCKSWKEMFHSSEFKRLVATLSVPPTQAFLIVQGKKQLTSVDSSQPFYVKNIWISTESDYKFHSLSLDFLPSPVVVVASCKSILCCWSGKAEIYLCNPVIQTWIEVPERVEHARWDFISLAFDTCTARCTLIMGRNSTADIRGFVLGKGVIRKGRNSTSENAIVVEMYDSKTNNWTQLETIVDNLVQPQGEGIYSNGKFYWLNELYEGDCLSIVAFDGDQKQWNVINGPQNIRVDIFSQSLGAAFVTGCEGRIVLVCTGHRSLWQLTIDEVAGESWSPLETMDDGHGLRSLMFCMDMAVNHSGCVLVFLPMTNDFAVWSEEAKILQKTVFGQLADFSDYLRSHISVRTFQVNNIFWP